MELTITARHDEEREIVSVSGEVDVSNANTLRDALDKALVSGVHDVVIDIAEVPYIDSTGIGVLVGVAHRAHDAGVAVTVQHPQRNVMRVLGLLGVDAELNLDCADTAEGE